MSFGYWGTILSVDLRTGRVERLHLEEDYYRMYMGGGALGSYFLLKHTRPDTDPLSADNVLVIAPGVTTGARVSGVSRYCVNALSPLTGMVGDSQAGGSFGPMIKRAGYDAIVIGGSASKPVYLLIEGDETRIMDAAHLRGHTVAEVHDMLTSELGSENISVLQCGPAGEKRVRFANLMSDLNDSIGRTGLGAVFGSKNLRAIVIRGVKEIPFADPDGLKEMNRLAAQRLPDSGFPGLLRKFGTPGVVGFQAEAGNFATHNYSRGYHEDYKKLDGEVFEPEIGAGMTSCFGCVVACRKKVMADTPYRVSDKLGGPEFETLGLLGSNLDITDPVVVARANELCNNYGLDTITTGGVAGYLFECMERGLIQPDSVDGRTVRFGDPESLFWLIEGIAGRTGVGDILAEGFGAMVKAFGKKTEPYAIHVKGQGLAVHMPQVKPSQALMYALCPIGPDHMSSEHDWLLASDSEAGRGLGIIGRGNAESTNLAKVRMTAYSQLYYSLLDTLSLCMFCWGPGNLFNYRDLVDLVRYTTGWDTTLWELMKVGERRINMMKQINARRGFSRVHDILPERLYKPLPDGPSKGRHVDADSFKGMVEQYYAIMGWDQHTGNPREDKLIELGLEWTLGDNP
jgi:aldehyde:ferredoxin oxidoreductase